MNIDKQKSVEEAGRIKELLLKSKSPDLGLTDADVEVKEDKEDGGFTITILKGKLPDHVAGEGASAKNISAVIDKDYEDFRRKGWVFTQPMGGSFRIAVPAAKVNEGFTFAAFLKESVGE